MTSPRISRPAFPKGYVENAASYLTWDWVSAQLIESKHYWLCSVRADGRPHAVPRWGVFLDNKLYYDGSPETRHALNIMKNPNVSLHLESGEQAIIMEGTSQAAEKPEPEFAQRLAKAIGEKYGAMGYAPEPNQWDQGGLFVFIPRQCIAWSKFTDNPTKFVFEA